MIQPERLVSGVDKDVRRIVGTGTVDQHIELREGLEALYRIDNEQKETSRCLAPHVQDQLLWGYDRAMEERGRGSVARQKVCPCYCLQNILFIQLLSDGLPQRCR